MFHETASLEHERKAAIQYLGDNWVLHPLYSRKKNPHHDLTHRTSETLRVFCRDMEAARTQQQCSSFET